MDEVSMQDCFDDPCAATDSLFTKIKSKFGRVNIRQPDEPAKQNSGEALNLPRRRALAAEGVDAQINAPLVGSGLNELANATVGTGRRLKPLPNAKRLGWTDEQYTEFVEDTKCLWIEDMYSKRKWIDQEGDQTLAEMQRSVLVNTIAAGEQYTLGFWFENEVRPFRTALNLIDNDRIRTPDNILQSQGQEQRQEVIGGHRKGPSGRTRSYFVHDYHRNDPRNTKPEESFREVRRYNEFGREQVIHTYIKKLPGMTRGLSELTSSFGKLKCFEKYEKVRMEAAIMQTAMAFVIKSNDKNVLGQIGGGMAMDDSMMKKAYAFAMKKALDSQTYYNQNSLTVDGVKGIRLLPDEEAEILTANQAGINDKQFVDECLSTIGRSLGLSKATITQDFEASYSAARATLISFYRQAENMGHYIVDDWLQSVYAMWLEDNIQSGRIQVPNYPDSGDAWMHFVLNREWYCGAEFMGPARDEIDQAKAMTYWKSRKDLGAFNLQEFYDSRGKDWQNEVKQQFEEMKFLDKLITECPLTHIDPLSFIHGKIEAPVEDAPEPEPENEQEQGFNQIDDD